ncbi:MAG: hypothetical protein V6Z82_03320 [Flavobacteriales bacterium]
MTKKSIHALKWEAVQQMISKKFGTESDVGLDDTLYLIGIQELRKTRQRFKKDDKVNLMHIGVCTLLIPYGYYRFVGKDRDGWPHFELLEKLPELKAGEQQVFIKRAIIQYFDQNQTLSQEFREIEAENT